MASILPSGTAYTVTSQTLPRAVEFAFDPYTGNFIYEDGQIKTVYDNDAVALWIWKALRTDAARWVVYPAEYGTDIKTLLGAGYSRGFVESEAKRLVTETINNAVSDYIETIDRVTVEFKSHTLYIDIELTTVYGKGGLTLDL